MDLSILLPEDEELHSLETLQDKPELLDQVVNESAAKEECSDAKENTVADMADHEALKLEYPIDNDTLEESQFEHGYVAEEDVEEEESQFEHGYVAEEEEEEVKEEDLEFEEAEEEEEEVKEEDLEFEEAEEEEEVKEEDLEFEEAEEEAEEVKEEDLEFEEAEAEAEGEAEKEAEEEEEAEAEEEEGEEEKNNNDLLKETHIKEIPKSYTENNDNDNAKNEWNHRRPRKTTIFVIEKIIDMLSYFFSKN